MIDPHLLVAFVAAVFVLMLIPGPNVAFIVANSVSHGPRYGLLTVAGTASAMVVQLALTGIGMIQMLGALAAWFVWLRWLGIGYLFYLGIQEWRCSGRVLNTDAPLLPWHRVYARAFLVSLTNPKTLFFYGAFFPQFLSPSHALGTQIWLLSATFLAIAIIVDSSWAIAAAKARAFVSGHERLRRRLTGSIFIGAGIGLAIARKK